MLMISFNKRVKCPWTQSEVEKVFKIIQKKIKASGELEVNVVGDKEIKDLNFRYRGKNKITDVLSFAWSRFSSEENRGSAISKGFEIGTKNLGQIYVCYPQIARQAKQLKIKTKEEFARMLMHGFLHILGYDHIKKKDAKEMFRIQEEIVCHYVDY